MTYRQALKYLESFVDYEKLNSYSYNKSFGLERIKKLLELLDNPQDNLRCIHVAGSKGKGSTCAFIAYILREAGYKVGLYTSPHLSDFRERIRILEPESRESKPKDAFEGMISRNDLVRLVEKIKASMCRDAINRVSTPTFFEIYTALAFLYFKEKKIDFAVLETGLGGRLDATNVVNPLVCVIAPISLEHTQLLGNSLSRIADEKAGIIKNNKIAVTAPQEKEALNVIKNRCKIVNAKLYQPKINKALKPQLLGWHQLVNANVAKAAVGALNLKIKPDLIKHGIEKTIWPGRCEVVAKNPLVVLDGAQNEASAAALAETIQDNFKYKRLILVLGISSDKDIKAICKRLIPLADKIILTQANSPRAANIDGIARVIKSATIKTKDVKTAKRAAFKLAGKKDLILVTGSLFVVGEFR